MCFCGQVDIGSFGGAGYGVKAKADIEVSYSELKSTQCVVMNDCVLHVQ